jgi:hypothetical protein
MRPPREAGGWVLTFEVCPRLLAPTADFCELFVVIRKYPLKLSWKGVFASPEVTASGEALSLLRYEQV